MNIVFGHRFCPFFLTTAEPRPYNLISSSCTRPALVYNERKFKTKLKWNISFLVDLAWTSHTGLTHSYLKMYHLFILRYMVRPRKCKTLLSSTWRIDFALCLRESSNTPRVPSAYHSSRTLLLASHFNFAIY